VLGCKDVARFSTLVAREKRVASNE